MAENFQVDKKGVRQAFDRAAKSYDAAAALQREINNRMMERLQYIKHDPKTILDLGSGTGYGTRALRTEYSKAHIVALDLALGMLMSARVQTPWWKRNLPLLQSRLDNYVCGDADRLPLKTSSVDMIWSNVTLQWCNDLNVTFAELHRVLAPEGLLMFSTFGPDTLKELRQAFSGLDGHTHVNRFTDMHDIGDVMMHAGFSAPVMDMEYITLTYLDLMSLLKEIKAMGAHNVTMGRRHGMMGKSEWAKLQSIYEQFRREGRLPATFEVVYGHAWVNQKNLKTSDGSQIIQMHIQRKKGAL
ncbi:malonyl-ACP O-methyltransferase BioC [Sulfurirhabdus autotrophica]|uniref:Malonyl-[acyl-carrier protein] O-methyltransferase n=1 Tax=Sulfurirhabdus autotrophica TaxID=1706046 RepID=A0A4R3XY83_9PROT|nr:malonyl-ACP O-methyltransferase BioC [Sulfurirhabdus autotrophica]TCV84765.1 malonyl-CoA O-methyltransferase [Sulfurirhabdus autotrophica]